MASVKIILRDERSNSEGKAPLFLRIIQNRKPTYMALGIFLAPKDWNDMEKKVRKSHSNSGIYNKYIAQKVAEAEGTIIEMETQEKKVRGKKIKEEIMGKAPVDFFHSQRNIKDRWKLPEKSEVPML